MTDYSGRALLAAAAKAAPFVACPQCGCDRVPGHRCPPGSARTARKRVARVGDTVRFQHQGATLSGAVVLAYDDWVRVEVAPGQRYDMDRFQEVVR